MGSLLIRVGPPRRKGGAQEVVFGESILKYLYFPQATSNCGSIEPLGGIPQSAVNDLTEIVPGNNMQYALSLAAALFKGVDRSGNWEPYSAIRFRVKDLVPTKLFQIDIGLETGIDRGFLESDTNLKAKKSSNIRLSDKGRAFVLRYSSSIATS